MAFKLTYSDGQEDDYDDSTKWVIEDGVLKMGREADKWTVLVSPSHWATIEVDQGREASKDRASDEGEGEDRTKTKTRTKTTTKTKATTKANAKIATTKTADPPISASGAPSEGLGWVADCTKDIKDRPTKCAARQYQ